MSKSLYLGENLVSIGGEPQYQGWQRPTGWLALPEVSPEEDKVVALIAVESGSNLNYGALTFLGGVDVDWGDGQVDQHTSPLLYEETGIYFSVNAQTDSLTVEQIESYIGNHLFSKIVGLSGIYDYTLHLDSVSVDDVQLEETTDYTFSDDTVYFNTTVEATQTINMSFRYTTSEPTYTIDTIEAILFTESNTFSVSYEEIWTKYLQDISIEPFPELLTLLSCTYTLKVKYVLLGGTLLQKGVDYNVVDQEIVFVNEVVEFSNLTIGLVTYNFKIENFNNDYSYNNQFQNVSNPIGINSNTVPTLAIQYDSDLDTYSVIEDPLFDGYSFGLKQEYWGASKTTTLLYPLVPNRATLYYGTLKHEYDFSELDPATQFTENGKTYRQAIVEITPLSGHFIDEISLLGYYGASNYTYTPNYLDVVISLPNAQLLQSNICPQAIQCSFLNLGKTVIFQHTDFNNATSLNSVVRQGDNLLDDILYRVKKFSITSDKFIQFSFFCDDFYTLEELYLNITNAFYMWESVDECETLKKVSGNLDVVFLRFPFEECFALSDASSLIVDLSNTKRVSYLFEETMVSSINMINTSGVENWDACFSNALSLKNLSNVDLNLSAAISAPMMFQNCYALESVDIYNTSGIADWSYCFYRCASLKGEIELDMSSGNNMDYMFYECFQIEKITLLNSENIDSAYSCFRGCRSLKEVTADWSSAFFVDDAFTECRNLHTINITNIGKNFEDNAYLYLNQLPLNRNALLNVFNNLTDISQNLQGATNLYINVVGCLGTPDLTESDLEIATDKGWIVTY
jgi:hypothetical protein